jgi:hypothetical protein
MDAVINPLLSIPQNVAAGLANGEYTRFGGIVRDASGRIIAHLMDVAPSAAGNAALAGISPPLAAANFLVQSGSGIYTSIKVRAIDQKMNLVLQALNSVLASSQIAAFASVAGIGVTIASTVYLAHRLNKISHQLGQIQKGLDSLKEGQDNMFRFLVQFADATSSKLKILRDGIKAVRLSDIYNSVARLQTELQVGTTETQLREAVHSELVLGNYARTVNPYEEEVMVFGPMIALYWAICIQTRCRLFMERGLYSEAVSQTEASGQVYRQKMEDWAGVLLRDDKKGYETAFRFCTPMIQKGAGNINVISALSEERIVRISRRDRSLLYGPSFEIIRDQNSNRIRDLKEEAMESYRSPNVPKERAKAEVLDGFSELADRVDSCTEVARIRYQLDLSDN